MVETNQDWNEMEKKEGGNNGNRGINPSSFEICLRVRYICRLNAQRVNVYVSSFGSLLSQAFPLFPFSNSSRTSTNEGPPSPLSREIRASRSLSLSFELREAKRNEGKRKRLQAPSHIPTDWQGALRCSGVYTSLETCSRYHSLKATP